MNVVRMLPAAALYCVLALERLRMLDYLHALLYKIIYQYRDTVTMLVSLVGFLGTRRLFDIDLSIRILHSFKKSEKCLMNFR